MEAAVENGTAVHELAFKHVRTGIVETNALVPGGNEEVVAVIREAEVRDAVGGRVGEFPSTTGRRSSAHSSGSESLED